MDAFSEIASTYDNEHAHIAAKDPDFVAEIQTVMNNFQQNDAYAFFYLQMLMDFTDTFIESPKEAVKRFAAKILDTENRLQWAADFE